MLSAVGFAIVLFASSNIDDIFVLLSFFANPKFKAREIILGQYLGFVLLVAVSLLASLVSLAFSPDLVGLLGFLPILIGGKKLFDLWAADDDTEREAGKPDFGNMLSVAGVTIANGADNIGIYTPVFATSSAVSILGTILVFLVMVAIWILLSHWLVNHRAIGAPIRRFGHIATPTVLIAIGAFILYEAGTLSLLLRFMVLFERSAS